MCLLGVCGQAVLQDLFPGVEIPQHDYGRLQSEILGVQEKRELQVVDSQVKVIQLFETTIVRHGVMLVGPTGNGKTIVYQVSRGQGCGGRAGCSLAKVVDSQVKVIQLVRYGVMPYRQRQDHRLPGQSWSGLWGRGVL